MGIPEREQREHRPSSTRTYKPTPSRCSAAGQPFTPVTDPRSVSIAAVGPRSWAASRFFLDEVDVAASDKRPLLRRRGPGRGGQA